MFQNYKWLSLGADEDSNEKACSEQCRHGKNEDAFCMGEDFIAVIDGATGLNKIRLTDAESDAAWMASKLSELIKQELQTDRGKSISETFLRCAEKIKKELDGLGYGESMLPYPSASISLVRIINGKVECYVLGDVVILLRQKDGRIVTFADTSVQERDGKVIEWMAETAKEQGITVANAQVLAKEMLVENRKAMNTDGGYWIFEPTGAGVGNILTATFICEDVCDIAIMSDGFYDAYDLFCIVDSEENFLNEIKHGNAMGIAHRMRKKQEEDRECNKYPRLKAKDDATVLYAEVGSD